MQCSKNRLGARVDSKLDLNELIFLEHFLRTLVHFKNRSKRQSNQ